MTQSIDDILIVGGGTAGWMTAAFLARRLATSRPGGVKITLIESSEIGIIGVGEGTFPSIMETMKAIGIDEARFMRGANATFKQGIRFVDWIHPPKGRRHSHYYHPFAAPRLLNGTDLAPYWLMGLAGDAPLSDAVTLQDKVCDAGRAPKRIDDPQYGGPMSYAYHFDAGKLAGLMKEVGIELGVRHLLGNVDEVKLAEDGSIASLATREHGELRAGLYIDCTGFAGALIGKAMGSAWIDKADVLFVDRALAMQVPYDRPDARLACTTISTAHEAGWTWDIGLPERRGIGYVFSSRHTDEARAEQVLRGYVGPASEGLTPRLLKLRLGHRDRHWIKNCVAVGLSGGFLEPLESTGIVLIEAAIWMLAKMFPRAGGMEATARLFNEAMTDRYLRAIDFIKLHYALSRRTDNAFWTDNADPPELDGKPSGIGRHVALAATRPVRFSEPPRIVQVVQLSVYSLWDGIPQRPCAEPAGLSPCRGCAGRVPAGAGGGGARGGGPARSPRPARRGLCPRLPFASAGSGRHRLAGRRRTPALTGRSTSRAKPPAEALAANPAREITTYLVGRERQPVVVIDNLLADPRALVELIAETVVFEPTPTAGNFYPGLRAPAPGGYVRCLSEALGPLVARTFPDLAGRKARASASVSLMTLQPQALNLAQRVPHFDAVDPGQIAILHYLCDARHGGTAFYRHRSTGFEALTAERVAFYVATLGRQLEQAPPAQAYITGDTPLFEQIGAVEARFDRAVIYPSRLLHSGNPAPGCSFSSDPRQGRLTGNSFLFF